jgi:hypothetical protein
VRCVSTAATVVQRVVATVSIHDQQAAESAAMKAVENLPTARLKSRSTT